MSVSVKMNLSGPSTPLVQMRSFDLFPTRIWQATLAHLAPNYPGWEAHIADLRAAGPIPAGGTVRAGWNSADLTVLNDAVFANLLFQVEAHITDVLEQMRQSYLSYSLQSWVTIHDRGGFNFPHAHEGCYLSGCFYLRVPEGSGSLVFRDPRDGARYGGFQGNGVNCHKDVKLAPHAGLLILFPSWLEHFVEPHGGDESRISIAFNARP